MSDADLSSRPIELNEPNATRPLSENLWARLLYSLIIAMLFSLLQSVLGVLAIIQFILLLANRRTPNPNIAKLGASLGRWCDRAARYLTAQSEEKPWPWQAFD
jgi:hypothetical protein